MAGSAEEALDVFARCQPQAAIIDLSLGSTNGVDLIRQLHQDYPDTRLLVLSMHDEALYADRVLRAGGDGYIMKEEDPEEVVHAIRDVLGGRIYVSEQVMAGVKETPPSSGSALKSRPLAQLADAELEVLELLGEGKTNLEVARQLHLQPESVNTHCKHIMRKLDLKTSNALIRYAVCWVEGGKD
jgi:DNA-binding NarL/FixJ family response regulator